MKEYPQIADPGLIGDRPTAALGSTDGTLHWFRSPRFDSPSNRSTDKTRRSGRVRRVPRGPN